MIDRLARRDDAWFVRDEFVVRGVETADRIAEEFGGDVDRLSDDPIGGVWVPFHLGDADADGQRVLDLVEFLTARGDQAQPNHVFWADADCCCPPHPADLADSLRRGGTGAQMRARPFRGYPFRGYPFRGYGELPVNTAVPAKERQFPVHTIAAPQANPRVAVLDTGHAVADARPGTQGPNFVGDAVDAPDVVGAGGNPNGDNYLDPVAGHGLFVGGIIDQLAPGTTIEAHRLIDVWGLVDEVKLATKLIELAARGDDAVDIISMSFGGPTVSDPLLLAFAASFASFRGKVLVASAGNDASCTRHFPAALSSVVAVGAMGPDGPAPFTNYGDWVDASAPGVDIVSYFFDGFNGDFPSQNDTDLDAFSGWAVWSGTSFSAPIVVAALCRAMMTTTQDDGTATTAKQAVEQVVRASHLAALPSLGVIVNP